MATRPCPVTPELEALVQAAGAAVGGGALAIDLVEDPQRGPLVVDIGHIGGFRDAVKATGVDIAGAIVEYVVEVASGQWPVVSGQEAAVQ